MEVTEQGRGRELLRHARTDGNGSLSPDGRWYAHLLSPPKSIRVVDLETGSSRTVDVQQLGFLSSLDWMADGNGFYCSSGAMGQGAVLARVDMDGKSKVVHREPGARQIWAVPSPDGKRIAMAGATLDSNVWLMESKPE